ncbi:hypothetical protein [Xanthomonas sp. 3058]|uniref:hypothetical protein n=1 Tax=Xanthomonas sp. 3058 TaxID=3035314 RepID=UPI0017C78416|nr:hypothetical protein [Xanthomonas sp. 3058]MBB5862932.1 hypothetical protein [Xanthomonas sp. 3058]
MRPHLQDVRAPVRSLWPSFVIATMLVACSASKAPQSEKQDLFLIKPFRVDATDEHVRFEFEATPDNVNLTQSYIVGLNLSRKGPIDPVTTLNKSESPVRYSLKVNACRWEEGICKKIFTEDNFQASLRKEPQKEEFLRWRVGNDEIKYISSGAYDSDSSNWIVCNLHLNKYGRYRVDISPKPGSIILNNPNATITIQKKLTSSK